MAFRIHSFPSRPHLLPIYFIKREEQTTKKKQIAWGYIHGAVEAISNLAYSTIRLPWQLPLHETGTGHMYRT